MPSNSGPISNFQFEDDTNVIKTGPSWSKLTSATGWRAKLVRTGLTNYSWQIWYLTSHFHWTNWFNKATYNTTRGACFASFFNFSLTWILAHKTGNSGPSQTYLQSLAPSISLTLFIQASCISWVEIFEWVLERYLLFCRVVLRRILCRFGELVEGLS